MTDLSKEQRAAMVAELGLTVESVFVPFSQSRNKAEKSPSLNWRVTVKRNGRDVLATDYSAGRGHCPAYKASVKTLGGPNSLMRSEAIATECETGRVAIAFPGGMIRGSLRNIIPLDTLDVLASLVMDSDVIDAGGFESWAMELGYDVDSRKAESIYQSCLEIALKLRAALGDSGLQTLRNAFEGY